MSTKRQTPKPARAAGQKASRPTARKRASTPDSTPPPIAANQPAPDATPPADWRAVFLAELAATGNVSAAAAKAQVHRSLPYQVRAAANGESPDPEAVAFAQAWKDALETACDALEMEARRRAVDGWEEPVGWYRGEAGGTVRKYSDYLLVALLRAHRPEKYAPRLEHTGPGGGAIPTHFTGEVIVELTPEAIEAKRKQRWKDAAPAIALAMQEGAFGPQAGAATAGWGHRITEIEVGADGDEDEDERMDDE